MQMTSKLKLSFLVASGAATLALLFATAVSAPAQEQPVLSRRRANYTIQVRLDPENKKLTATEVLTWRNDMRVPARELWFHLYWNAWKNNRSTWLREDVLRREEPRKLKPGDYSYIQVKSLKVLAAGPFREADLTEQMRYESPDDGNPDDQTVLAVSLPRPVRPGETVRVELTFESKIPRTFARTGFRGNYFFIAHWFPKLGVFQQDGAWNCHQFHAPTEFFSDYGVYDVAITVPAGWKVGATGREVTVTDNGDATATHRFQQADVHDFAWTTSPDYRESRRTFDVPGLPPVEMRFLYQPEHEEQVDRHFRATEVALRAYGTWFGPYPYGHVTLIDPAWESRARGMEYPTLFTCGTRLWNPPGSGRPEGVTIHEAGHQFWYGIVGNNEFEDAWVDEGLNTFSEERARALAYGEDAYVQRFFHDFVPVMIPEIRRGRTTISTGINRYRDAARGNVPATPTYRYHPASAAAITYSKTALWLATLENMLGWDTLQKIMATFFQRWKFRHPKPDDFFAVAHSVSGQDLTSFFDQVHRRAAVFDFAVESVSSEPVKTEGFVDRNGEPAASPEKESETEEEALYETRVVIRRLQDGILPVEVLLRFENGEELREVWDTQALWKEYRLVKPAKLDFAAVDPDHKLLLDINYTNNSQRLTARATLPAVKWASKWMIWLQDYLHTLLFLF